MRKAQKVVKETNSDKIIQNEKKKMSEENPFMTEEELREAGNNAVQAFANLSGVLKIKEEKEESEPEE
jgi:hypothetical protein